MGEYALCKYLGEYINQKLNICWDDTIHPEDMNKIIDARIRQYATRNMLHTVYSRLYDELKPDFKKYWCNSINVRLLLKPTEPEIMEIINDTLDNYFYGACDYHIRDFMSHFDWEYKMRYSY